MKIIFTGGGTDGHIFPILAIAREIRTIFPDKDIRLYYIGPDGEYSLELLRKEGVIIKKIITGKIRRYFSLMNLLDIFKIPIGIIQSFFWLFFLSPDIVFSKGGYGSFPTTLMANLLSIPIFLHESDIVPGLSSRIESKWAQEIFVSFHKTEFFPKNRRIVIGNPIRKEILNGSKERAKEIFNIQTEKPLILILGGSQGCQKINEVLLEILPELLKDFEVIHQIGKKNFNQNMNEVNAIIVDEQIKKSYHAFAFLNEEFLRQGLAGADLIISRAGAGSIFEIAANRKPAILIPLARSAQDHQLKNAYAFANQGGAEVIEEANFTSHFFLTKLKQLFSRPGILKQMAERSQEFSQPKAAKIIASYLIEYIIGIRQNNNITKVDSVNRKLG